MCDIYSIDDMELREYTSKLKMPAATEEDMLLEGLINDISSKLKGTTNPSEMASTLFSGENMAAFYEKMQANVKSGKIDMKRMLNRLLKIASTMTDEQPAAETPSESKIELMGQRRSQKTRGDRTIGMISYSININFP